MNQLSTYIAVAVAGVIAVVAFITLSPDPKALLPIPNDAAASMARGQMVNFTLSTEAKPAPEVNFTDGEANPLTLADFRGKVVLVNLWATWCGPCIREMPTLDRLQAELGSADFEVVAIAQDRKGLEVVTPFVRDHGLEQLRVYIDSSSQATRAFGALGLPTSVLIDRAGNEIGRLIGPAEWDSPEAFALIRYFIGQAES